MSRFVFGESTTSIKVYMNIWRILKFEGAVVFRNFIKTNFQIITFQGERKKLYDKNRTFSKSEGVTSE